MKRRGYKQSNIENTPYSRISMVTTLIIYVDDMTKKRLKKLQRYLATYIVQNEEPWRT